MKPNEKEIYRLALKKYGLGAQMNKLKEELAELIVALSKEKWSGADSITEEIADVLILIEQMIYAKNLEFLIQCIKEHKLKRLFDTHELARVQ